MGAGAPIFAIVMSTIGTASSIVTAKNNENTAKRQQKRTAQLQETELRRQERIETARAKRLARMKSAKINATAGAAGVTGSIVDAPTVGVESVLEGQIDELNSQTNLAIKEGYNYSVPSANGKIGQALGAFGSDVVDFFEYIDKE